MEKTFSLPFEEALERISQTTTLEDLSSLMAELRDLYGLANIVYHAVHLPSVQTPNPIVLFTYDPEWVKRYTERDYVRIDPVVRNGRRGFLPLDWSDVDQETFTARSFFEEADRFGVGRNGVTIPIRGPGGERALFSVTSNVSSGEWNSRRLMYMRDFQLLSHFLHDRVMHLSNLRPMETKVALSSPEQELIQFFHQGRRSLIQQKPQVKSLSNDEAEVLRWAAIGKTAWETSIIMRISERKVRFLLTEAQNKLHTVNRTATVVQALVKGEIKI